MSGEIDGLKHAVGSGDILSTVQKERDAALLRCGDVFRDLG